jgi:hypothetical protein
VEWSDEGFSFFSQGDVRALRLLASVGDIIAGTVLRGHCVEA